MNQTFNIPYSRQYCLYINVFKPFIDFGILKVSAHTTEDYKLLKILLLWKNINIQSILHFSWHCTVCMYFQETQKYKEIYCKFECTLAWNVVIFKHKFLIYHIFSLYIWHPLSLWNWSTDVIMKYGQNLL